MAAKAEESHRGVEKPFTNFTMCQYFEWYCEGKGVHWNKFKSEVPRLASMGITACWLPPPTKGSTVDGTGYDTYDLWDLGEFDQKGAKRTNWGTKEELVEAVKVAKEAGIISYIDAVLNHKMGGDKCEEFLATAVAEDDRTKKISEMHNIEGWTKYTFPGRGDTYSPLKWGWQFFTGVDYDNKTGETSIFKIQGDGKDWADNVDSENKNYDFLMGCDVDHAHPDVVADLNKWGDWVLKTTGASGFRFDAIKHIDEKFISQFVKHVRKEAGNDSLFCVGEFWKDSFDTINGYLERMGTQFSVFDAPLHYNFKEAGESKSNYDLRKLLDDTIVKARPVDAVTLVDNHDTQVGQSLESWVDSGFKPLAYAVILMRPDGYPCVFYGDLYGCAGENPQPPVSQLEDFIRARKLFAYGECHDYWDHPNCVGWVRTGNEDRDPCAIVICNGSEGAKKMEIGKDHAGEKWTDVLGWHTEELTIGEDGWCEFKCPAGSVSIWTKTDARGREEFKKE